MKIKIVILIFGVALILAGISISVIESQMWWNKPAKLENGVGIMKEITATDQFVMSLSKIWLLIILGGIGMILADIAIFIRKKGK